MDRRNLLTMFAAVVAPSSADAQGADRSIPQQPNNREIIFSHTYDTLRPPVRIVLSPNSMRVEGLGPIPSEKTSAETKSVRSAAQLRASAALGRDASGAEAVILNPEIIEAYHHDVLEGRTTSDGALAAGAGLNTYVNYVTGLPAVRLALLTDSPSIHADSGLANLSAAGVSIFSFKATGNARNLNFEGASVAQTSFGHGIVKDISFKDGKSSDFSGLSTGFFFNCKPDNIYYSGSASRLIIFTDVASVSNSSFRDLNGTILITNFDGISASTFLNCDFVGGKFVDIKGQNDTQVSFENCSFTGFGLSSGKLVNFKKSEFSNCVLLGTDFSPAELKALSTNNITTLDELKSGLKVKLATSQRLSDLMPLCRSAEWILRSQEVQDRIAKSDRPVTGADKDELKSLLGAAYAIYPDLREQVRAQIKEEPAPAIPGPNAPRSAPVLSN